MAEDRRSVFGPVDQDAILANIDVVDDEDVDSDFLVVEMNRYMGAQHHEPPTDGAESGPGLVDPTPEMSRAFVLYGPAGLAV